MSIQVLEKLQWKHAIGHYVNAWHGGSKPKFPEVYEQLGGNTKEYRAYANRMYRLAHPELRKKWIAKKAVRYQVDEKFRQSLRDAHRKHIQKTKLLVFTHYSESPPKCACCGIRGLDFLTLDHINNDGAKQRLQTLGAKNMGGMHTYSWLKKRGFPQGFQVLCWNCNAAKHINKGTCPHQVRNTRV